MRSDRWVAVLSTLAVLACAPAKAPAEAPIGMSTGSVRASEPPAPEVSAEPDPPPPPPPNKPPSAPPTPKPVVAKDSAALKDSAATKEALVKESELRMREILARGGTALKSALERSEEYRFQVLYGEIVTKNGKPSLERLGYRADAEYFFPASSMKMPIALATYDRLATLRRAGKPHLTRDATLRIHPLNGNGEPLVTTLAHEAKRALIVSDNFSANRLLAIVGHREVHETLWGLGLGSARVHTGFATGAEIDPAEASPAVDVVVDGATVAGLAARKSNLELPATDATALDIGDSKIVDGRKVPGPLSFADKNAMRLRDLQDTLVRIMRPELLAATPPVVRKGVKPISLTAPADDLEHLRMILGTLPSDSGLAGYARNLVADYQLSPFLRGIERVRPRGRFQIYSKVGQAYGFLIHNAYVVEKDTGRAFFLIAAIYANPDGTMNSDKYAYDSVSFPVLADVGEVFARQVFGD